MWRVDFAFVEQRLAVEIEGGIYRGGGHTTVNGIRRDIAKANQLMFDGWRLLRVHGDQVRSGEAVELIRQALEG
jgi:very-short-patch-repair endonuclease